MIISVTGHRPDKLGGYDPLAVAKVDLFATEILERIRQKHGDFEIVTGMAQGWDQAVATACVHLHIPFTVALPGTWQADRWPVAAQKRYGVLLAHAREVVYTTTGPYAAWKLHHRNGWMINKLVGAQDFLLALWNGSSGGTGSTIAQAEDTFDLVLMRERWRITNVWPEWVCMAAGGVIR